jgi:Fe-Mn family superoxide dismutase
MRIDFKDLPYSADALEPVCSARTLRLHHGKHHRGYFDKTVELIKGSKFEDMTLDEIVRASAGDGKYLDLFHNAAQVWNHDLFWQSMRPGGGGKPTGDLLGMIARDFGSQDRLCKALHECGVKQFGSGWAWLVVDGGKLAVIATSNADNPLSAGKTALLAIDVWEHAYYLDYENRRPEFIDAFLDRLVNWQYASDRLSQVAERDSDRPVSQRRRRA